jgi:L,D-peptidoglycan transpeptidase YkuD (ErfK/YbiS/YcfS/YnhG family)
MSSLAAAAVLAATVLVGVALPGRTPAGASLASPQPIAAVAMTTTPDGGGYWTVRNDGTVSAEGDAPMLGDVSSSRLNRPIVGMAATPDGRGYWLVASDGGIFAFGDAEFYGSTGAMTLNQPIVGMASTGDGHGYWLVAADGGIFAFGDAAFYGSTGTMTLNQPIVGMAATPDGHGYSLVASDGGIFSFGNAEFHGSTGAMTLNQPIVGMATTGDGHGYWLVASDGGLFTYGDATFDGSMGGSPLARPVVGMAAAPGGGGYWMVASDGGIFSFGNAEFHGATVLNLAEEVATTGSARQLVVVDAPSFGSTTSTLTTWVKTGSTWQPAMPAMPATNGYSGWEYAASRHEGDGSTPIGLYPIGSTIYGNDANPGISYPYHQLMCGDWWDEDSSSPGYNTFEHVACGTTPPFAATSEALWTETNAYPYLAVIDFNTPAAGPYGSGIFLHADIGQPTNGCVSLPLADLVSVLQWLEPTMDPMVVMGPDSVIRNY